MSKEVENDYNTLIVCAIKGPGSLIIITSILEYEAYPDSKVHGANMGPPQADRTQVGPMMAPWNLLSGYGSCILLQ